MNIEVLQPKPFDLVGDTIMIAGNAVGFEAHLSVTVTDGHGEVVGSATAGSVQIRQFQASIPIPAGLTSGEFFAQAFTFGGELRASAGVACGFGPGN